MITEVLPHMISISISISISIRLYINELANRKTTKLVLDSLARVIYCLLLLLSVVGRLTS